MKKVSYFTRWQDDNGLIFKMVTMINNLFQKSGEISLHMKLRDAFNIALSVRQQGTIKRWDVIDKIVF